MISMTKWLAELEVVIVSMTVLEENLYSFKNFINYLAVKYTC